MSLKLFQPRDDLCEHKESGLRNCATEMFDTMFLPDVVALMIANVATTIETPTCGAYYRMNGEISCYRRSCPKVIGETALR